MSVSPINRYHRRPFLCLLACIYFSNSPVWSAPQKVPQDAGAKASINELLQYVPTKNQTPPRFQRMEPDGVVDTSDYFDEIMKATGSRVFRFAEMPIPVWIQPINQAGFVDACSNAFEAWESRSNGLVRFTAVPDAKQARIKIVWVHLGRLQINTNSPLGAHTITKWHTKDGGLLTANSEVLVPPQAIEVNLDSIMSRDVDNRLVELKNVITHELGHAIGLIGHSPVRGDLMFNDTDEFSRLSQRDLNTLRKLYLLPPNVRL